MVHGTSRDSPNAADRMHMMESLRSPSAVTCSSARARWPGKRPVTARRIQTDRFLTNTETGGET